MFVLADDLIFSIVKNAALVFVATLIGMVVLAIMVRYVSLWVIAKRSGVGIDMFDLLGMTYRKVNPMIIVAAKVKAAQAGIDLSKISVQTLELHYLAGGDPRRVIAAMIESQRMGGERTFDEAAALDLANELPDLPVDFRS